MVAARCDRVAQCDCLKTFSNYWLLVVYGIINLGIKVALSVLISKKQITKINYENK